MVKLAQTRKRGPPSTPAEILFWCSAQIKLNNNNNKEFHGVGWVVQSIMQTLQLELSQLEVELGCANFVFLTSRRSAPPYRISCTSHYKLSKSSRKLQQSKSFLYILSSNCVNYWSVRSACDQRSKLRQATFLGIISPNLLTLSNIIQKPRRGGRRVPKFCMGS